MRNIAKMLPLLGVLASGCRVEPTYTPIVSAPIAPKQVQSSVVKLPLKAKSSTKKIEIKPVRIVGSRWDEINKIFDRARRIKYESDVKNEGDYWQTPYETIRRAEGEFLGKGDCEDSAFFMDYFLKKRGIKSEVKMGKTIIPSEGYHAWVEFEKDGESFFMDPIINEEIKKISTLGINEYVKWGISPERYFEYYSRLAEHEKQFGKLDFN